MFRNLKYSLPLIAALMFSACSTKDEVNIDKNNTKEVKKDDIETKLQKQRVEADKCQQLPQIDAKLSCYNDIIETNTFAMLRMGIHYADKLKNYPEAVKLFEKMIENGNYHGNLALAFLYFRGKGVEQNLERAHNLLVRSYEQDPNAAYQLSRFYLKGLGTIQKDEKKALGFITSAANRGLYMAQKKLYRVYRDGLYGIEPSEENAKFWKEKYQKNDFNSFSKLYQL